MRIHGIAIGVAVVAAANAGVACRRSSIVPAFSATALSDIVGEWQSDTVGGNSARSTCSRSPQGAAVICEQTIATEQGTRHAVNVYASDDAGGHYYYGIAEPGEAITATRLEITAHVWVYGGAVAAANGMYYRTVNDFSPMGRYTWRTESSPDRVHWTITRQGSATLVRNIGR